MKQETFINFWKEHESGLKDLITYLISNIDDDARIEGQEDDDDTPTMQLTISVNRDCTEWSYQTGDNSYTGSCYGHPHWAVGYLTRDCKPSEILEELLDEFCIEFES